MKWIEVKSSGPLNGEVTIPGSKNSTLGLLAAACLSNEPITLKGLPNILDFYTIKSMGEDIGLNIEGKPPNDVIVDPRNISSAIFDTKKTSNFRSSYYFIASLLHKFGKVELGLPGGDDFGSRPIDQHLKGYKALGAKVKISSKKIIVEATTLIGTEINFDVITSGATINLMIAGVHAKGKTILTNSAIDPEVVDVANFLNFMGADIRGAGTSTIIIHGVNQIHGCNYRVIPDRLIAGTMLMAAGTTNGKITINDVIPEHMSSTIIKLKEAGIGIEVGDSHIIAYGDFSISPVHIKTGMYPGFATDLQQPISSMLLRADGISTITDYIYPHRIKHVEQLKKLDANIEFNGKMVMIKGGRPLKGSVVRATDVRAGVSLVLAGLIAEGVTKIIDINHILRGGKETIDLLSLLGADIRINDTEEDYNELAVQN